MSFDTTEERLQELFAAYGEVVSVNAITDRANGRPRGGQFTCGDGRRIEEEVAFDDEAHRISTWQRVSRPRLLLRAVDLLALRIDGHRIALQGEGVAVPADEGGPLARGQSTQDVVQAQDLRVGAGDDLQGLLFG